MSDPISPIDCEHPNPFFLQSARTIGDDVTGASNVTLCPDCGRFTALIYHNGEGVAIRFEIANEEHWQAARKYIDYIRQGEHLVEDANAALFS